MSFFLQPLFFFPLFLFTFNFFLSSSHPNKALRAVWIVVEEAFPERDGIRWSEDPQEAGVNLDFYAGK